MWACSRTLSDVTQQAQLRSPAFLIDTMSVVLRQVNEVCVDHCSSTATNVVNTSHTCAQRFLTPTTTYLKVPLSHGRVQ